MFIAKMATRYPDYHGEGYYNFLMDDDEESLDAKIEEYSHDFMLDKVVETEHETVDDVVEEYPSKAELNKALFL